MGVPWLHAKWHRNVKLKSRTALAVDWATATTILVDWAVVEVFVAVEVAAAVTVVEPAFAVRNTRRSSCKCSMLHFVILNIHENKITSSFAPPFFL